MTDSQPCVAHEWVGNHSVKCVRCGVRSEIKQMGDAPPCKLHYVFKTAGWPPMTEAEIARHLQMQSNG